MKAYVVSYIYLKIWLQEQSAETSGRRALNSVCKQKQQHTKVMFPDTVERWALGFIVFSKTPRRKRPTKAPSIYSSNWTLYNRAC